MLFTMVTPSFCRDYERCELLCRSIDRFVDRSVRHLLIVDDRDLRTFRSLDGGRTTVVRISDVVPRLPRWTSGWIVQQLAKIEAAAIVDTDGVVFCDSDTVFVRRWEPAELCDGDKVGLYRRLAVGIHPEFHCTASRLLGMSDRLPVDRTYVGNLITWRRETAVALSAHLTDVLGSHWVRKAAQQRHLSEYVLYGRFVEQVLTGHQGHFMDPRQRSHDLWFRPEGGLAGLHAFIAAQPAKCPVMMVSARIGFSVEDYEQRIEEIWDRA